MPRYKKYDYNQLELIPIDFSEQILPGTFEFSLNYLVDHNVDLTLKVAKDGGHPKSRLYDF